MFTQEVEDLTPEWVTKEVLTGVSNYPISCNLQNRVTKRLIFQCENHRPQFLHANSRMELSSPLIPEPHQARMLPTVSLTSWPHSPRACSVFAVVQPPTLKPSLILSSTTWSSTRWRLARSQRFTPPLISPSLSSTTTVANSWHLSSWLAGTRSRVDRSTLCPWAVWLSARRSTSVDPVASTQWATLMPTTGQTWPRKRPFNWYRPVSHFTFVSDYFNPATTYWSINL